MGIKYYYSAPQQIRLGYFLADAVGNYLYTLPNSKCVKNLPRVTICSILKDNILTFGFATCSSKDQYIKKRGQKIARERAIKNPYAIYEVNNVEEIHSVTDKVIEEIFKLETLRIYR